MTGNLGDVAKVAYFNLGRQGREAWQAAAEAVMAEIAKWPTCGECHGKGSGIFRKPELHATDRLLYQMTCPACEGLGRSQP